MTQDTVRKIEENIQVLKGIVELENCLVRLEANRDFQKVIRQGYLQAEAIRLVHLRSDPAMVLPEKQAAIVRDIDGIAALVSYFRTVSFNAKVAAKGIEADEEAVAEILAEDAA